MNTATPQPNARLSGSAKTVRPLQMFFRHGWNTIIPMSTGGHKIHRALLTLESHDAHTVITANGSQFRLEPKATTLPM